LAANPFHGAAKATQNAIDMSSDLVANSFDRTANSTQNPIDVPSDLVPNSLLELLMQLKIKLISLLI
jgi:hypothetical protein